MMTVQLDHFAKGYHKAGSVAEVISYALELSKRSIPFGHSF